MGRQSQKYGATMSDEIGKWLIANIVLIPILMVYLYIGMRSEVKRLDKRINAMIKLLKYRGIDLDDESSDFF